LSTLWQEELVVVAEKKTKEPTENKIKISLYLDFAGASVTRLEATKMKPTMVKLRWAHAPFFVMNEKNLRYMVEIQAEILLKVTLNTINQTNLSSKFTT
jgi:hypothetical protein